MQSVQGDTFPDQSTLPVDKSKSFTPILGYSNIAQPVVYVAENIIINMRALKTRLKSLSSLTEANVL